MYLTTDPRVLGILAWASAAITVLGFAVAIWQILRVKRAADAARDAALGLARRVRSRELLAKLGDAHTHLEAARNHVGRGERQMTLVRLELASGCAIDAREIRRTQGAGADELDILVVAMSELMAHFTEMFEPLTADPNFIRLQLDLGRASQLLQSARARSRYQYDLGKD